MRKLKVKKRCFTLIELVIVIITISILSAMAMLKFIGVPDNAHVVAMEQDLDVIENAVIQYVMANNYSSYPFLDINNDNKINEEDLYFKKNPLPKTLMDSLSNTFGDDGSMIYELDMIKLKPYINKIKYPKTNYLYSKKSKIAIDPNGKKDRKNIIHYIIGQKSIESSIKTKPIVTLTTNLDDVTRDTIIKWEYSFIDEDKEPTKISFILNDVEYDNFDKIPTKLEEGEYTIKLKMQDSKGLWSDEFIKNFTIKYNILIENTTFSIGYDFSMKISENGNLYAWGSNSKGQLGIGNKTNKTTPQLITLPNKDKPIFVIAGDEHSMAITNEGNLYSWGWNYYGQLGIGNTVDKTTPQKVTIPNGEKAIFLELGGSNSMVITDKGNLYSWGYNVNGQLGIGNTNNQTTPQLVTIPNGEKPISVSCGFFHTLVITSEGNLYSFGNNLNGELGIGNTIEQLLPQKVTIPNGEKPISVKAGLNHTLVLTNENNLYSFGSNSYGVLGLGDVTNQTTPQKVTIPNGEKSIQIETGYIHSFTLTDKGNVYSWGRNLVGQLGIGNVSNQATPQPTILPIGEIPKYIYSGYYHSMMISNEGNYYAWGKNSVGQFGNGKTTNQQLIPLKIELP